jgi:hypothetical protein
VGRIGLYKVFTKNVSQDVRPALSCRVPRVLGLPSDLANLRDSAATLPRSRAKDVVALQQTWNNSLRIFYE